MSEWKPIETAPTGTDPLSPILAVEADESFPAFWVVYECWQDFDGKPVWFNGDVTVKPTHWMELPEPPAVTPA